MRFSKFTLKNKILLGISLPIVALFVLAAESFMNMRSLVHTTSWLDHTHVVLSQSSAIIGSAVDMETGMRGYLLAGKEAFLDPYREGEKATYQQIEALQKKVSDNPTQVDRLTQVEKVLREWQNDVTEPTIALRRKIGDAPTMNDMAKEVGKARGKQYFDKLRAQLKLFADREAALLVKRQHDFEKAKEGVKDNLGFMEKSRNWVEHTHKVIAEANTLLALAVDMETGMRGYLLAGEKQFLEPYHAGEKQFFSRLKQLKKTVSDNPVQVKRLTDMEQKISVWNRDVVKKVIALRKRVNSGVAQRIDVDNVVSRAQGKTYFDAFRKLVADFIAMEEKLMVRRQMEAKNAQKEMNIQVRIMEDSEKWVTHTYEVIDKAHTVLAAAVDMETGMRGYLLAGKVQFLEPYNHGSKVFFERTAALKKKVSDNAVQVKLLTEVDANIRQWQQKVTQPVIALRRQIGDAKTMDDMADLIGEARGKAYFDKFRQIMADFQKDEERLMQIRRQDNENTINESDTITLITLILATLLGLGFGWKVIRDVMGQLGCEPGEIEDIARRVASGDLVGAMQGMENRKRSGAFGSMAKMVTDLREIFSEITKQGLNLAQSSRALDDIAKNLSSGAQDTQNDASAASQEMEKANQDMASVVTTATQLRQNMENVSENIGQVDNNLGAISAAAEEASANLDTVAAAAEEASSSMTQVVGSAERSNENISGVASSVGEISTSIGAVRSQCESARVQSQKANQHANTSAEEMKNLTKASSEIDKVIDLINDIADQTNMLALNASIESAGAGEAGKGFAVVANEVKDLARQTGEATTTIVTQIDEMNMQTDNVERAIAEVSTITEDINVANQEILYSVEEQSSATEEISRSMAKATEETVEVTRLVGESTEGITEVSRNVQELSLGIGEVTRSVSDIAQNMGSVVQDVNVASTGSSDVFKRISEANEATAKVSHSLEQINEKAGSVLALSASVNEKAGEMAGMSSSLEQMLQRFKL
ncbi:CHASE3 domain-containing protein [Magnetococcales bacterium HHB-1]